MKIRGITVTLLDRIQTGADPFGMPAWVETETEVENVLVSPAVQGGQDVIDQMQLSGRRAEYVLALPKGDSHEWEGRTVKFFGQSFRAYTIPSEGIEGNIPLNWNRKVLVERYE